MPIHLGPLLLAIKRPFTSEQEPHKRNTCPLLRDIHDCYMHQVVFDIFKLHFVRFSHLKRIYCIERELLCVIIPL